MYWLRHHSNERLRPRDCADPQEDAEKVSPPKLWHLVDLVALDVGKPAMKNYQWDGKHSTHSTQDLMVITQEMIYDIYDLRDDLWNWIYHTTCS